MRKVIVGGGSGFIGRHLKTVLTSQGYQVINVTRKAKSYNDIEWIDIEKNGLPDGVHSVVNLAGINIMSLCRFTEGFQKELVASRVETTGLLARSINASTNPPRSFISSSAIGFYGFKDRGVDCDERTSPGDDFVSDLCVKWEAAADTLSNDETRLVKMRIGLVMGKGGGLFQNLYPAFFMGVGGNIGDGKQWFPWIHIDDITGLIQYSMENPVTGVLNAVSPQSVTNSEFTVALASAMWRPAFLPLPVFALRLIYGDIRANMMSQSPKIKPSKALELGYQFKFDDVREACEDLVT